VGTAVGIKSSPWLLESELTVDNIRYRQFKGKGNYWVFGNDGRKILELLGIIIPFHRQACYYDFL
jgi:hypothetical protein